MQTKKWLSAPLRGWTTHFNIVLQEGWKSMVPVSKTRSSHFHQNYTGPFPAVTASNGERNGILFSKEWEHREKGEIAGYVINQYLLISMLSKFTIHPSSKALYGAHLWGQKFISGHFFPVGMWAVTRRSSSSVSWVFPRDCRVYFLQNVCF